MSDQTRPSVQTIVKYTEDGKEYQIATDAPSDLVSDKVYLAIKMGGFIAISSRSGTTFFDPGACSRVSVSSLSPHPPDRETLVGIVVPEVTVSR